MNLNSQIKICPKSIRSYHLKIENAQIFSSIRHTWKENDKLKCHIV